MHAHVGISVHKPGLSSAAPNNDGNVGTPVLRLVEPKDLGRFIGVPPSVVGNRVFKFEKAKGQYLGTNRVDFGLPFTFLTRLRIPTNRPLYGVSPLLYCKGFTRDASTSSSTGRDLSTFEFEAYFANMGSNSYEKLVFRLVGGSSTNTQEWEVDFPSGVRSIENLAESCAVAKHSLLF